MITDPIADMLTQIRNAQIRGIENIEVPHSGIKEAIAEVLKDRGYIEEVKIFKHKGKSHKGISIALKYSEDGIPAITKIDRVSKPGLRQYRKSSEIKPVLNGFGIYIISTPRGVIASREARTKKLGGEIICRVY